MIRSPLMHAFLATVLSSLIFGDRPAPAQVPPLAGESAQESAGAPPPRKTAEPAPFPVGGDPRPAIASALTLAAKENQRVLLVWGGNWCGWSTELAALLEKNRAVAREVLYEYRVVFVDIGRFDTHLDLAKEYGVDIAAGSPPFLTVLAPATDGSPTPRAIVNTDGRIVSREGEEPSTPGRGGRPAAGATDPLALQMWLASYRAPPLDANALFQGALAEAKGGGRRVFLLFSAPW